MSEIILDVNTQFTKVLDNVSTVIKSHGNEFVYQINEVSRSVSIDQGSNTSVHVEKTSYSDTGKIKHEYNVNALERLIYSLLKEGDTKEAKSILKEFKDYSSPLIDKWKTSFSKSSKKENITASLSKNEIEVESKLINRCKDDFSSQWVALVADRIIASNKNLLELKKEIKALNISDDITFLKL